ncbi:MAG: ImmA/IrrE family metallo-endopeptidase [Ruminococcus sp.]|nr:ImmA/IrrE family metallo-endopeptidase [Ruminococcus sp.]MCR5142528.1 ImmA/IrrE family metallo-endopeptidase [Ruminococcus sp.]
MSYIYDMVNELIAEHGARDPFLLCRELGVSCFTDELGGLSGLFTYIGDVPVIIVSSSLCDEDRRLACAHELGHYFLHSAIAKESTLREFEIFNMKDKVEYDANIFAAHLLIDDAEMIALLKDGHDVFRTAMELRVNPNLLNIKLSELNGMGYRFDTDWGSTRLF